MPGPGDYSRTIVSGGVARSYELHVPPAWSTGAELPLVLAFHGAQSSPSGLQSASGLDPVADAVLDEIEDLGFVLDLIDQLEEDVGIDTRRVYVIGISNGALFVHYLACAAQRNVTAAASVAATLIAPVHIPSCDDDRPIPIAFFLGSHDTFFPPGVRLAGNEIVHVRLLSIEESVDTWVERDGCSGAADSEDLPDVHDDGTRVRRHRYSDCASGSEVGGLLGRTSREISATEIALRFFLDHIL